MKDKEPWWKRTGITQEITATMERVRPLRYISEEEAAQLVMLLDECRGIIAGYRMADNTPRTEHSLKYHIAHLLSVAGTVPGVEVTDVRGEIDGRPVTHIDIKWSKSEGSTPESAGANNHPV